MTGARVLIIDDEQQLRRALRRTLEGHDFVVHEASDGESGVSAYGTFRPDVVLLDLMLPDVDGVEVCRRLMAIRSVPVIVLSVVGDEATKVLALDQGADDYLTKPFGSEELLARIRVALRRSGGKQPEASMRFGPLFLDPERRFVTLDGVELHLTPTEYSLLLYLAGNAGKVLTHPMILRAVWGNEYAQDTHVLRTYINQLRAKLRDDPTSPRFIRTDPGVGYRFAEAEHDS
jgi:two-component system KDP operon response regulator KdpE